MGPTLVTYKCGAEASIRAAHIKLSIFTPTYSCGCRFFRLLEPIYYCQRGGTWQAVTQLHAHAYVCMTIIS